MTMDEAQLVNQFSKYIRKIILPKYEDIMDFEIIIKDGFGDKLFVDFIFEMDGTEYEIEQEIIEDTRNMIDLFGMDKIKYGFKFDTL
jgi:hypothetical protein